MDTSDAIQIDVIIPVLNEQEYILSCLNSVCSFVLPKNVNLQIFVIDGCSKDETLRIALEFAADKDNIFVLNNPGIIQATALNIGIKQSKADYILRLDAHSEYPSDYLANCLETALRTSACNVGGMAITKASSSSLSATLVQAISTSKFGVGDSGFRVGAEEGVRDTVPYGFFKREIFNKYGLFNERLARAQDYEFNKRIQNEGGKIWFNPKIYFSYYNQSSFYSFIIKQIMKEAPFNAYMWYLAPYSFSVRHSVTLFFALGIIGGLVLTLFEISYLLSLIFFNIVSLYFILGIYFSIKQSRRYKRFSLLPCLPFAFFVFHLTHGIGILAGIIRLIFNAAPVQRNN